MRLACFIPAVAALFISGAAYAQTWDSYVNRENFFSINLPGEPAVKEAPYKTVKGTNLTARVFTAVAPAGETVAARAQCGFDRHALGGRLDVTLATVLAHQPRSANAVLEFLRVGVELQDAALEVVVAEAGRRASDCGAIYLATYVLGRDFKTDTSCAVATVKDKLASTGSFREFYKALVTSPAFVTRDPNLVVQ
jgi:hypothetical protein